MAGRQPGGLGRNAADIVYQQLLEESQNAGKPKGRSTIAGSAQANYAADFGPYYVGRASEYYQGPKKSTRVSAHQFVPSDPNMQQMVQTGSDWVLSNQLYWAISGHIYVRFQKYSTLWKYGPCTLQDYKFFRDYYSKGRYVRDLEKYGHGRAAEGEAGVLI